MINNEANIIAPATQADAPPVREQRIETPLLPDEPLIKIRASEPQAASVLQDVWAHRELLYFLIWRDLKVRYKQTILGAAWVILQPLLTVIVFTVFMSKLARVPSDGVPYPLFAYAGLLPWLFFSNTIQSSSLSLIMNSYIITKVYFPRLIIPAALLGVRLVDFFIASAMLLIMMLYYGMHAGWSVLMFPVFVLQVMLLTLGCSLWSAALNTLYRDFGALLSVLLQLWMFASPVIYPSSLVPERWRLVYASNPVAGIIEGFRASLFNWQFNWTSIVVSVVITLLVLGSGIRVFCRVEEKLADLL